MPIHVLCKSHFLATIAFLPCKVSLLILLFTFAFAFSFYALTAEQVQ